MSYPCRANCDAFWRNFQSASDWTHVCQAAAKTLIKSDLAEKTKAYAIIVVSWGALALVLPRSSCLYVHITANCWNGSWSAVHGEKPEVNELQQPGESPLANRRLAY